MPLATRADRPKRQKCPRGLTAGSATAARVGTAALLTAAAAVPVFPDLMGGLDRRSPLAQLVAFRPAMLGGLAGVTLVLVALVTWRRKVWPFAAGAIVLVLVGAIVVAPRLAPDAVGGGRPFTVLTANVYEGNGSPVQLAALIAAGRPDLVAITEAGAPYRARLAPLVEPLGYRLYGSTRPDAPDSPDSPDSPDIEGITALARADLGELTATVDSATPFPTLVLTGGGLDDLRFVTFHSIAPSPGAVRQWRADLSRLPLWCAGPTPVIVAGDFNATLDHSTLRTAAAGCVDAGEQSGNGLVATWPARWPPWFGVQIDHVFAGRGSSTEWASVHPIDGSDHRAVLARVRVAGQTPTGFTP